MSEFPIQEPASRLPIIKAHFLGRAKSNVVSPSETGAKAFASSGAIEPPYDPGVLIVLVEHSNALRQNIDSYVTNIDGFGHRFEEVLDLYGKEASDQIRSLLEYERDEEKLLRLGLDDIGIDAELNLSGEVQESDVQERLTGMQREAQREKRTVERFFENCCLDDSFVAFRRKLRFDLEVTGNAYYEVVRNRSGRISQLTYVPAFTMRLMPLGPLCSYQQKIKTDDFKYENREVSKRFRQYVQIIDGVTQCYFKEFGDPRLVSSKTGKILKSRDEMERNNDRLKDCDKDSVATEIIHLRLHSPRSPYGVPRWVGALLSVLGSRQAEEVNVLYFQNKSVPPMAMLVSGGTLHPETVTRIENYIESEIKGTGNFHKIMVLEAQGSSTSLSTGSESTVKIELVPLTGAQHNDALFQEYDRRNIDKVGQSFRLPKLLRGDIDDFPGRATAEAALGFAEMQVFAPERHDFDWTINKMIMADLGVRFWKFVSNTPKTRNASELAEIIERLVAASTISTNEARTLASDVLNKDFKKLDGDWADLPILAKSLLGGGEHAEAELPTDEKDTSAKKMPKQETTFQKMSSLLGTKSVLGSPALQEKASALKELSEPEVISIPFDVHKGEWADPL